MRLALWSRFIEPAVISQCRIERKSQSNFVASKNCSSIRPMFVPCKNSSPVKNHVLFQVLFCEKTRNFIVQSGFSMCFLGFEKNTANSDGGLIDEIHK